MNFVYSHSKYIAFSFDAGVEGIGEVHALKLITKFGMVNLLTFFVVLKACYSI